MPSLRIAAPLALAATLSLFVASARAQLQWSEYADTASTIGGKSYTAGQLMSSAAGTGGDTTSGGSNAKVTFTVPANSTVDFATTNFTPFTLSSTNKAVKVSLSFSASGGLSGSGRIFAIGLVNSTGSTLVRNGYSADVNLGSSPQAFEFFAAPTPPAAAANGGIVQYLSAQQLNSGKTTGLTFGNATTYTGFFQINFVSSTGVTIGTSSSGANAGMTFTDGNTTLSGDGTTLKTTAADIAPTLTVNTFVFGFANTTGSPVTLTLGSVSLVPVGPPTISGQPASVATSVGGGASFSVTAFANPAGTYSWSLGGSPLTDGVQPDGSSVSGSQTANLTLSNAQLDENGAAVTVTVTNTQGSITSSAAALTVTQAATAPGAGTQPGNQSVNAGATATFTFAATGSPVPTYQWYFVPTGGGTPVTVSDGNGISGSTTGTLTITTASPAEAGSYYAVATNLAGSVQSSSATLNIVNAGPAITAVSPGSSNASVPVDTPLSITFADPVTIGTTGTIKIYNASTHALVDTIDVAASGLTAAQIHATEGIQAIESSRAFEGQTFNYYPIIVTGSTAVIYPHQSLSYGTSYYVTIDTGVFVDSVTNNDFQGIYDASTWTFATKASGPAAGATTLVVATDNSGDFATVQGALDFLPSGNTTPRTIYIKSGTYNALTFDNGRSDITFLGQDRAGTVLEYCNNNTFNSAGGSFYYRGAFEAYGSNLVFTNLTIKNTTPHGGSQAEALIVQGSQEILEQISLYSYQDTLQINGSAYIGDSYIQGDVDFMWGTGPNFFYNCQLIAATSSGYYAQIRNNQPNGTANHGNVYVNCTVSALSGVTGSYLARIDPTVFPYSEVAYINCKLGTNLAATGWLLNNATTAPNVNYLYAGLTDLNGNAYNTSGWQYARAITDPTMLSNYQSAPYILNGWTPAFAPIFLSQPAGQSVPQGQSVSFTASTTSVPAPTYQWSLNGTPLSDGTQSDGSVVSGSITATLTIQNVGTAEGGNYTVAATSGGMTTNSAAAALTVTVPLPVFTTQPAPSTVSEGGTVSLTGAATNAASYQWYFDGAAISGNATATAQTLVLSGVTPANAGNYTLVASDASGPVSSSAAILDVTAASGHPTLPTIPSGVYVVTAYGAVGDGATDNTVAFQNTINAALAAGGGTVEVPAAAAAYLCGPITLGSNLNFQVDAGAKVQALPYASYPSNTSPANFISASGASNIMLSGGGTIDGNGSGWWTAYSQNSSQKRPQLIKLNGCSNVLVTGLTFSNGMKEHVVLDAETNVTIDAITISAPATSPNTDGIDPAGTNYLIENCSIATGDDNIAVKPQSVLCSNFVITGCSFGVGHGLSVGGQTNAGLNGMTVTNCTFTGTTSGLRLKADPTEGGLVQNVTYSNLTMTGVAYPIVFYSYYNLIGTPGTTSGSSQVTPAKALADNSTPPTSLASGTIPGWQNITLNNITATGASGYSVIWGVPLANGLFSGVTLNNVTVTGGAGLDVYDAANVQFTGTTSVGPVITANALAITGQPQSAGANAGGSATFTVTTAGTSGANSTAPLFAWSFNGAPLSDGTQSDGSVVSGSATAALTVSNLRVADAGAYTVTVSNSLDGYNTSASALAPNSLSVSATSQPALLTVAPAAATVGLSNLSQTYDGTAKAVSVTTSPAGLAVQVTYNGSTTLPVNAGTYSVAATITDANYAGSASGTLTIGQGAAAVTLGNVTTAYTGSAVGATVTTSPSGLLALFSYNGVPAAITPAGDSLAGYAAAGGQTIYVVTTGSSSGAVSGTNPYTYDSPVGAAAVQAGVLTSGQSAVLQVQLLTNGYQIVGLAPGGYTLGPVAPGSYSVTATVFDPNYTGSATGTITVVPTVMVKSISSLAGTVEASIELLTPTNTTIAANATVSGDLLVPGLPTVSLNSSAIYAGTQTGTGTASEPAYSVTVGANATLRHVILATDPLALPAVVTPPAPTGTRSVTLSTGGASAGDWSTLLNLTVTSKAGNVAVPPGTYGTLTANAGTGFILGVAGSSTPSVYNLQTLTVSGVATVQVVGPVILNVARNVGINAALGVAPAGAVAAIGSSTNHAWLTLNAAGNVSVSGPTTLYGAVAAPTGTVSTATGAKIQATVAAQTLSLSAGTVLEAP